MTIIVNVKTVMFVRVFVLLIIRLLSADELYSDIVLKLPRICFCRLEF